MSSSLLVSLNPFTVTSQFDISFISILIDLILLI